MHRLEGSPSTKRGRLIIFCGVPGSGKTTIARLVASAIGRAVHVQTDAIRSMIANPVYDWREARFVYEAMFLVGGQALRSGYDAILDGTFLREDYRAEALAELRGDFSGFAVVCVLCDLEVARRRNSQRTPAVPDESFGRLAASFERPKAAVFVRSDKLSPEESAALVVRRVERLTRYARRGPARL